LIAFITHPDCPLHEMGEGHPGRPGRLPAMEDGLIAARLDSLRMRFEAPLATREQLLRVHEAAYLDAMRTHVDIVYLGLRNGWDKVGFVNGYAALDGPDGKYADYLPGPDGRLERVRADDGVHLADAGARRLAAAYAAKARECWARDSGNVLKLQQSEFDARVRELKRQIAAVVAGKRGSFRHPRWTPDRARSTAAPRGAPSRRRRAVPNRHRRGRPLRPTTGRRRCSRAPGRAGRPRPPAWRPASPTSRFRRTGRKKPNGLSRA